MDVISECTKCMHCEVCKFKDEYLKAVKKLNSDVTLDWITTSYLCKYYHENVPTIRGTLTVPSISTNTWPTTCETCDWYKRYVLGHETYIGDSPCQWCNNYPYKITCGGASTATSIKDIDVKLTAKNKLIE